MDLHRRLMKRLRKIFKRDVKSREQNIKRFVPTDKQFLGKKLFIHDIASFHLCNEELFKSEMYKFTAKREDPYIIDCGANLGMSIIYFKQLYPKAVITAFEADDYIYDFLKKNMHSFDFKNVEIINKAVWNSDQSLSFLVEGGAGGRLEQKKAEGNYKKVSCTRLKKFLSGKEVDFLKMDIEGAEYEVIKDCEDELKNVEQIFIEYHSFPKKKQNLHKILKIIQGAGFKYHIKEAFTSKLPFIKRNYNVGMDLQLNIFCYRD